MVAADPCNHNNSRRRHEAIEPAPDQLKKPAVEDRARAAVNMPQLGFF